MTAAAGTTTGPRIRRSFRDLAGTGTLLRLALRRDRIMMPAWVLILGASVSSQPGTIKSLYDTAAERAATAHDMNGNGSMRALYGIAFNDSVGGLATWRIGTSACVMVAIMSLFIVVRHTRDEEETGRQEMLSSGMVGHRAGLTAALIAAGIANACVALFITVGLASQGAAGALALGLAVGGSGMVFAGMASVAAQVTENTRLARGLTAAAVGLFYLLRMAGDAAKDASTGSSHPLTWFTPLGWAENVRPYAGERWWALLPIVALTAVAIASAYLLAVRRDVGAGFFASRPGPASAGRSLQGTYGLAWRLQRGSLLGWVIAFVFSGALFGGITTGAEDIVSGSKRTREIFERMGGQQGVTDAFLAAMVGALGLACAVYAAGSVLRLYDEESGNRAEPLLASAVSRLRWAASHLAMAYLGTLVVLAFGGLAMGIGYGSPPTTWAGSFRASWPPSSRRPRRSGSSPAWRSS